MPDRRDRSVSFSALIAVNHQIIRFGIRALLEESFQTRIDREAECGSHALRAFW